MTQAWQSFPPQPSVACVSSSQPCSHATGQEDSPSKDPPSEDSPSQGSVWLGQRSRLCRSQQAASVCLSSPSLNFTQICL